MADNSMGCDSQLIICADGTVLAATGGFPARIVTHRLEDGDELPPAAVAAAAELVRELNRSGQPSLTTSIALQGGGTGQLIAIRALGLRRLPTDLRALLPAKLAVLTFQARAVNVALTTTVDEAVPETVHVDAEKLAWAVTTLVGNALRYMSPRSHRVGMGTIRVVVGFDAAAAQLTTEVHDDGPGIPADTVARLFRRDGLNVAGAGLSLLVMSDICAAHGGAMSVHSDTSGATHGTVVRLIWSAR